jgi:hypothetical protein
VDEVIGTHNTSVYCGWSANERIRRRRARLQVTTARTLALLASSASAFTGEVRPASVSAQEGCCPVSPPGGKGPSSCEGRQFDEEGSEVDGKRGSEFE